VAWLDVDAWLADEAEVSDEPALTDIACAGAAASVRAATQGNSAILMIVLVSKLCICS